VGQHEPNETADTAFFLGTLAFPGAAPDGGVSTNFYRFDDVKTWWGSDTDSDFYSFTPFALETVRIDFNISEVGDYYAYIAVWPLRGVSAVDGVCVATWGDSNAVLPNEKDIIDGTVEGLVDRYVDRGASGEVYIDDPSLLDTAEWTLTGEDVVFQVQGMLAVPGDGPGGVSGGAGITGDWNFLPVDYTLDIRPARGTDPTGDPNETGDGGGGDPTPDDSVPVEFVENGIYRFYNPQTGAHFYTASFDEAESVAAAGWGLSYEGVAFRSTPQTDTASIPFYRFFNTQTGTHFYTSSEAERDYVNETYPWFSDEGIAFYVHARPDNDDTALFRFYNSQTGTHFYTAGEEERDVIVETLPQWSYEGVAAYVDVA